MKHHITTPVDSNVLGKLKAGDQVYISGKIYTARDQAHLRLINDNDLKFSLEGAVIYYVGPTPARPGNPIGSSGPTSSYRMDQLSVPLMERGVKMMIGKGNRSDSFREEMIRHNSIYLIATGGAGALLASCIKSSKVIMYEELGTEAVHELFVENFPCFVAYDLYNESIFSNQKRGEL